MDEGTTLRPRIWPGFRAALKFMIGRVLLLVDRFLILISANHFSCWNSRKIVDHVSDDVILIGNEIN